MLISLASALAAFATVPPGACGEKQASVKENTTSSWWIVAKLLAVMLVKFGLLYNHNGLALRLLSPKSHFFLTPNIYLLFWQQLGGVAVHQC